VDQIVGGLLLCVSQMCQNVQPGLSSLDEVHQRFVMKGEVVDAAGDFFFGEGSYRFSIVTNAMGGYHSLMLGRNQQLRAEDVVNVVPINDHILAYCTSPMYGTPGLYVIDYSQDRVKCLVAPKGLSEAYPEGADYFEIRCVTVTDPPRIIYYYSPDVDATDFLHFRILDNQFSVRMDGGLPEKAANEVRCIR